MVLRYRTKSVFCNMRHVGKIPYKRALCVTDHTVIDCYFAKFSRRSVVKLDLDFFLVILREIILICENERITHIQPLPAQAPPTSNTNLHLRFLRSIGK